MYLALERYSRPRTLRDALVLLGEPRESTAFLAGGTEINVRGHEALTHVVDLQALPLRDIADEMDTLRIGALVTLAQLQRHEAFQGELLTGLREAAAGYANMALQNRSTLGGRVLVDRSDHDLPAILLALGARLRILRLEAEGGVMEEFIDYPATAAARVALEGALLADVLIPVENPGKSAYRRFGRTAVDTPLACGACVLRGEELHLVAGLQGPGPHDLRRLTTTETLLACMQEFWGGQGKRPQDWREVVRESIAGELEAYEDAWAGGEYRRDLTATLMVRALAAVLGEEEVQ